MSASLPSPEAALRQQLDDLCASAGSTVQPEQQAQLLEQVSLATPEASLQQGGVTSAWMPTPCSSQGCCAELLCSCLPECASRGQLLPLIGLEHVTARGSCVPGARHLDTVRVVLTPLPCFQVQEMCERCSAAGISTKYAKKVASRLQRAGPARAALQTAVDAGELAALEAALQDARGLRRWEFGLADAR